MLAACLHRRHDGTWRVPEPSRGALSANGHGGKPAQPAQWKQLQQALSKLLLPLPGGGQCSASSGCTALGAAAWHGGEATTACSLQPWHRPLIPGSLPDSRPGRAAHTLVRLRPAARLAAGVGRQAPPAAVLLSLGVYTAMAAAAWVVVRLQGAGGAAGLPWS